MRSSTLALLFLISIQAAVNPGGDARAHGNTRQEASVNAATLTASRPSEAGRQHPNSQPIPIVDPKLFNRRRHRSPRVLFSALPPNTEVAPRVRKRAVKPMHRGEYSVCDSISDWVGNKTRATDMSGNEVTVLPNFNVGNTVLQQYFFETTCHSGGGGGYSSSSSSSTGASSGSSRARSSGCRGIDSRHWNSYCSNTHTYVRALTSFKNQVGWKYIRINTACVCVLSRKSWKH